MASGEVLLFLVYHRVYGDSYNNKSLILFICKHHNKFLMKSCSYVILSPYEYVREN